LVGLARLAPTPLKYFNKKSMAIASTADRSADQRDNIQHRRKQPTPAKAADIGESRKQPTKKKRGSGVLGYLYIVYMRCTTTTTTAEVTTEWLHAACLQEMHGSLV
jgi:hypothetical protein